MALTILHTNDFHGKLDHAKASFIRGLKGESGLYVDTGDVIKAGNLAIPLKPEAAWPRLAAAGCDASVPGNRESHVLRAAVEAKFAGRAHPVLCANWRAKEGANPFARSLILERAGLKVGLFGVMVPIVTAKMATQAASAYLWDQPIAVACEVAEELRANVDVVIALTHIGFTRDQELADKGAPIDLIFGGHSHTVLESPVRIGRTWIAQGGSHGRYVGRYEWDGKDLKGGLLPLPQD